jgi:predicted dehydrogenase
MVKAAVIGVGNIGHHHARNYYHIKGVDLVAVSDINPKQGKKVADQFQTKFYQDYHELIQNEDISHISIAVPTNFHTPVFVDVAKYVKNILLEKPISHNVADAKKILINAKKENVETYIGYVERFNPAIQALKKIIDTGELGDILSIIIRRVGLYPPVPNQTDVITDLATHDIDILNYLFKTSPKIVSATGGKFLQGHIDHAQLLLTYNKIPCFIQANWVTPVKTRNMVITGTKGYIEVNFIEQELTYYKPQKNYDFKDFAEFLNNYSSVEKKVIKVKKNEPLFLELKEFTMSKASQPELATSEDGFRALETAEEALVMIKK